MIKSSPVKQFSVIRSIAFVFWIYASHVSADWRSVLPDANLVGKADFRLYGFHVYEARLWSHVVEPDLLSPFALEFNYRRAIDKETLINASLDEMRQIADDSLYRRRSEVWADEMRRSFVDVKPGSRITGLYLPGFGCQFYVDGRLHHEVADPIFAKIFFAIWLAPKTRHPELREQLLGLKDSRDEGERQ